jgi:hypothetical protein
MCSPTSRNVGPDALDLTKRNEHMDSSRLSRIAFMQVYRAGENVGLGKTVSIP